ncbi:MAG TPA: hypothetical protein VFS52_20135 [Steroidobacteraceae bacterium]|jgi:hypothetical protein|nr:hypothetical protein [Steroidobacteraceae bacterium]
MRALLLRIRGFSARIRSDAHAVNQPLEARAAMRAHVVGIYKQEYILLLVVVCF